jgi:hypothetical protein
MAPRSRADDKPIRIAFLHPNCGGMRPLIRSLALLAFGGGGAVLIEDIR